jgi:hypothetical protein
MSNFIYNSNLWPKTKNSVTDKLEKVSVQNFVVLNITRDKITVMCCGDHQEPIQFDIVIWQDTLAAINIKIVEDSDENWAKGMTEKEFFNTLGYEYPEVC